MDFSTLLVIGGLAGLVAAGGVVVVLRYYDRVHAKVSTALLVALTLIVLGASTAVDCIPGGEVTVLTSFSALGIALIVWSRPARAGKSNEDHHARWRRSR